MTARAFAVGYPSRWLRAWAAIVQSWPGAGRPPRLDVCTCGDGGVELDVSGLYDPVEHAVEIYPTLSPDRWDALDTLIHEYAHAWAPGDTRAHGPAWRRTYVALYEYLFGLRFSDKEALELHDELMATDVDHRREMSGYGRGAALLGKLATFWHLSVLRQLEPDVKGYESDGETWISVQLPFPEVVMYTAAGNRQRKTFRARELHRVRIDHDTGIVEPAHLAGIRADLIIIDGNR